MLAMKSDRINLNCNGKFTVTYDGGEHRTFRIKEEKWCEGKRVLSMLKGADNSRDYQGFAFVYDNYKDPCDVSSCRIVVWRKYLSSQWAKLAGQIEYYGITGTLPEGWVSVNCSQKCIKCGRTLTTPESIQAGVGPVCGGRE